MAALDGKITIGIEYRPCIMHIPEQRELRRKANEDFPREIVIAPAQDIKAIFHTWNTFTGKRHRRIFRRNNPRGRANADTVCGQCNE